MAAYEHWKPPARYAGWNEWKAAFVAMVPEVHKLIAGRFVDVLHEAEASPHKMIREWWYWFAVPGNQRYANWPKFLDSVDWASLTRFAETETRMARKEKLSKAAG